MTRPLQDMPIGEYVEGLASRTPTPGGGSAACAVASVGIALARMVLAWSIEKESLAQHEDANSLDDAALKDLARHALALADADALAYGSLNALWKKPEDDPEREAGWDGAVEAAIDAPMRLMRAATDALDRCEGMRERTNPMLHSDLSGAIHLLVAALHAAGETVRVNLPLVRDDARRAALDAQLADLLD